MRTERTFEDGLQYVPLEEVLAMSSEELRTWWQNPNKSPNSLVSEYMAQDPALIRQLMNVFSDQEMRSAYYALHDEVLLSINLYGLDPVWEDYIKQHMVGRKDDAAKRNPQE